MSASSLVNFSQRSSWIRLLSGLESQSSPGGTKRTDGNTFNAFTKNTYTMYINTWHQTLVVWCVFIETGHIQAAVKLLQCNSMAVCKLIPVPQGYVKVIGPL